MATMEQQRISWGELRERAHALRLKSLKAGEPGLSVRVSDLLETLPLPYDPEPLCVHLGKAAQNVGAVG